MRALWKLLVVLLLTLPPAAYVAGMVVGPPDLPYRNPEAPASPRPQARVVRPVTSGTPVAATPQTGEGSDVLAGRENQRRRVRPHEADAHRRAGGSRSPRPRPDTARLAVPGLTTPPAPATPGPDYLQQAPAFPDLGPATPDATPQAPYDPTTPDTPGDLLDPPTPMDQGPGSDPSAPTPPAG